MELLLLIVTGAIAGWAAGHLMRGRGFGLAVNVILGIIGGLIGGRLAVLLGIDLAGWLSQLAMAVLGAVLVLAVVDLIRRLR